MYQTNEPFELTLTSDRGPLQAKETTASYEEDEFEFEPSVHAGAWLSGRLSYIDSATDQTLQLPSAAPEDTFEMSRWNSVFGMTLSACMTQKNPVRIEMPLNDWCWCADPL